MHKKAWTEAGLISFLRDRCTSAPEALNFFDDCAIFPKDKQSYWLISKDCSTEGVHFLEKYFSASEIAHKVFHTSVSDIAAMGGRPHYILLGLSLPKGQPMMWVRAFLKSFCECARAAKVRIIGGDTTRSPGPLFCSATVLGSVSKSHLKRRSGAQAENLIALTGSFGHAALGLRMLDKPELAPKYPELIKAQKKPVALIERAQILGKSSLVTAMLDVSDGITRDAQNLGLASGLRAHIDCQKVAITASARNGARDLGLSPLKIILEGGEDYGLMVAVNNCVDETRFKRLLIEADLTLIGTLQKGTPGVRFDNAPSSLLDDPPLIFEHGG